MGNLIKEKYKLEDKIMESTFSNVYRCSNIKTKHKYCMKIIKDSKTFFDQALREIHILDYLKKSGNPIKDRFLYMQEFFYLNVILKRIIYI